MPTQIQFKRGTAASMAALNPVLTAGEPGYETDTRKVKIGDGTTAWNSLRYVTDAIVNSPTALSADQNNYVLPATADIFRFTSSTPVTITGIAAGYHGQQETLINVGSSAITLAHNSSNSAVGNRFSTSWSVNLVLNPGNFVRIVYDGTSAVWRVDAAPSTFDGSQIASGTVAAERLPVATTAQALTGTDTATMLTPAAMHQSRRGSGRAKFFEVFTDFACSFSGQITSDGIVLPPSVSGAGSSATLSSSPFRSSDFSGRASAGILALQTGTTSTGRAGFDNWDGSHFPRFDVGTSTYETLVYLPDLASAAEDYVFRIGHFRSTQLTNDVIGFEYDRAASANWRGMTGLNGNYSRVNTGVAVAAGQWVLLRMVWTSSLATFFVNAANGVTLSANIRADGGGNLGAHMLKTAGTTSRAALVDYVYYRIDFNNDRTFS